MSKKISQFDQITIRNDNDWLLIEEASTGAYKKIKVSDFIAELSTVSNPPKQLNYSSNGDTNGAFYWIGLNGGTTWTNSHTAGLIELSTSSVFNAFGYGDIATLINRTDSSFATDNFPDSWIQIDLKSKKLKINRYTLKRQTDTQSNPINWKLEASADTINWTTINTETNQTSLNSTGYYLSPTLTSNNFFRFFRFTQTGVNSSGGQYFILNEIEMYGELQ